MGFKNDLVHTLANSDVYNLRIEDLDEKMTAVTVSRNGVTHNFQFDRTGISGTTAAYAILRRT